MCSFTLFSETHSFKFVKYEYDIPIYSIHNKGEKISKKRKSKQNSINFNVTNHDFDEFAEQVKDVISFLEKYSSVILDIKKKCFVDDCILDFPLYSRLNSDIVVQYDRLPQKLISEASKIGASIEMSYYSPEPFRDS